MRAPTAGFRCSEPVPTGAPGRLALAEVGWQVHLEDPLLAEHKLCGRQRAFTPVHSSRLLLQRWALWQELTPDLASVRSLATLYLEVRRAKCRFSSADLGPAASGMQRGHLDCVGWVLQHRALDGASSGAARSQPIGRCPLGRGW